MAKQDDEMDYEVSASDLAEVKCNECNIAFRTNEELDEHNKTEHNAPAPPEGRNSRRRMARESEKESEEQITA